MYCSIKRTVAKKNSKAILLHRRSFFTIFPSLVNSHLIQKCILSSNITDNQVCQLSQFCFDSFFSSKRNDFTNFNVAKYYISSVVVSMYLSKAKESTGKSTESTYNIAQVLNWISNQVRLSIHPLYFDEKKLALSSQPWKKNNNTETINLGFIE